MKEGLSTLSTRIKWYKGGVKMGVVFFRKGQPFQSVNKLPESEQEQFITRWNKWEEKLWHAAYQHLLEKFDPNESMKVEILPKGKSDLPIK
jgi:hypothetical protein